MFVTLFLYLMEVLIGAISIYKSYALWKNGVSSFVVRRLPSSSSCTKWFGLIMFTYIIHIHNYSSIVGLKFKAYACDYKVLVEDEKPIILKSSST
jgi:hypothetical protein